MMRVEGGQVARVFFPGRRIRVGYAEGSRQRVEDGGGVLGCIFPFSF